MYGLSEIDPVIQDNVTVTVFVEKIVKHYLAP